MLDSFRSQQLQGATVFADDDPAQWNVFHLKPNEPSWRLDENGVPRVRFFLYRDRVDRPDGPKGGYMVFDTEFTVPDDKRALIQQTLQSQVDAEEQRRRIEPPAAVVLHEIAITDATCNANIADGNGTFFERIANPGRPSKFGRRVATWSMELSEQGGALVDAALRAQGTSLFQIVYEIKWLAALPPLRVTTSFNAAKFYDFTETIDCSASYEEVLSTVRTQVAAAAAGNSHTQRPQLLGQRGRSDEGFLQPWTTSE